MSLGLYLLFSTLTIGVAWVCHGLVHRRTVLRLKQYEMHYAVHKEMPNSNIAW